MVEVANITQAYKDEYFVALGGDEFRSDHDEINYRVYNETYEVNINGKDYKARDCRVSKYPFNRPWPGHQRDFSQSEAAAFISIFSDEPVLIKLKASNVEFKKPVIRPMSKKVRVKAENDEAVFELTQYGHYVFEPKDEHNALHIFYEKPKQYPDKENATYYFGAGMHFPGVVHLRDNESVYIDKDAVVFGSIYSDGAENIRIFGGGNLDNTCEERFTENCYEPYVKGAIRLYNCKNVSIEDVILTNSSNWVLAVFDSDNVTVDNVKIVGQWRYNTDGIDITNTSNVLIKNSFIRSFDDTITIKAIYKYDKPIENITVDNCVMWCGWGKNAEVGVETDAPEYRNITFKNCDLIHNSSAAMDINNGCGCEIHDITFENINIEYQAEAHMPVLQRTSEEIYKDSDEIFVPKLIFIYNATFPIRQKTKEGVIRMGCEMPGQVYNVLYKNINVYLPEEVKMPEIFVCSVKPDVMYKNIVIDGISVNEIPQKDLKEKFKVTEENTEAIKLL